MSSSSSSSYISSSGDSEYVVSDDESLWSDSEDPVYFDGHEIFSELVKEADKRKKAVRVAVEAMIREKKAQTIQFGIRRCQQETLTKSVETVDIFLDEIAEKLEKRTRVAVDLLAKYKQGKGDLLVNFEVFEKKADIFTDLLGKYKQGTGGLQVKRGYPYPLKEANELREEIVKIVDASAACNKMIQRLGIDFYEAASLFNKHKRKRDKLRKPQLEASIPSLCPLFVEFPLSEIIEATNTFTPSYLVVKGYYARVCEANLRHNKVTIKKFKHYGSRSLLKFQHEVNIMSNLRHPNLATPIGGCLSPEAWALVYEYAPRDGNLMNRLECTNPPLTWKARFRIAWEIFSAISYLHAYTALGVVHGNLNPANILLDSNDVCKLSDFGIPSVTTESRFKSRFTKGLHHEMYAYIDPKYCGKATKWSDIYSYGKVLLKLLSGKPPGSLHEVRYAFKRGNVKDLLDQVAGEWPLVQTEELARLAVRCSAYSWGKRQRAQELSAELLNFFESVRGLFI